MRGLYPALALRASVISSIAILLSFTHVGPVLAVRSCDSVRKRDDEASIFFDFFRRDLLLQQGYGITQVLQSMLLDLFQGVIVRVVSFRFRRHDLI